MKSNFETILVLGRGVEHDGALTESSHARAISAAKYARQFDGKVIFCGRRSFLQDNETQSSVSEAYAMAEAAEDYGLPTSRILLEETSYTTMGNIIESKKLGYLEKTARLGMVAQPAHLRRGMFIARVTLPDISVVGLPAPGEADARIRIQEYTHLGALRVLFAGVEVGNQFEIDARQAKFESVAGRISGILEKLTV